MKYILKHVNLLDGTKNMTLQEDMDVVVENGLFKEVGKNIFREGAELIDLSGKYLCPGLINLHVHLPGSGYPTKRQKDNKPLVKFVKGNFIGNKVGEILTKTYAEVNLLSGATTIRSVGGVGHFDALVRDNIEKGKYLGSRIVCCNEAVTVAGGHMEGTVSYGAKDIPDMVRHIEKQVEDGADWIKIMITGGVLDAKKKGEPGEMKMNAAEVKACTEAAHRLGKKVCAHVESPEGVVVAVENGVDSIEHGAEVTDEIIQTLKKNNGVVVCTLSPAIPCCYFDCGFPDPDMAVANGMTLKAGIVQCAKECLKNGVTLGMGTDAGCPYTTHYDLWRELEYFHHYLDISREESLHIATLGNAGILGLDNEIGSIEPGKSADFIVSSKNPLDNFDALRKLDMVSLKGNIINNPTPRKSAEAEKELDNFYYNKLAND